jgi:hypothetical protein
VPLEGTRRLRAVAKDADGRPILAGLQCEWLLEGAGTLEPNGAVAVYRSPSEPCEARVRVAATQGAAGAEGEASLSVRDVGDPDAGDSNGVPDPEPVHAPGEPWRSRAEERRWQFNTAHPDFRRVQDDARLRLRYLVHLFAKEVVLRNFGRPQDAPLLERMVEVLTHVGEGKVAPRATPGPEGEPA